MWRGGEGWGGGKDGKVSLLSHYHMRTHASIMADFVPPQLSLHKVRQTPMGWYEDRVYCSHTHTHTHTHTHALKNGRKIDREGERERGERLERREGWGSVQ